MKPADNRSTLVAVAASLQVSSPQLWTDRPHATPDGRVVALPGSGGVALGLHAGMPVDAVVADHAVPGVSLEGDEAHGLVCVGNRVRRADGGDFGVVAGKRGGLAPGFIPGQYVGVEASEERLEQVAPGETVVVEAYGRGLALVDFPAVALLNCSPRTLDALGIDEQGGTLHVAVRAVVSGEAIGPGIGSDPWIGDLEIDGATGHLNFGDVVALEHVDSRVSRFCRRGYVTVGVVSHGPSPVAGHGVGVTVLLSGPADLLRVQADGAASLAPDLLRWSRAGGSEWT